jgi:hypothetical protein
VEYNRLRNGFKSVGVRYDSKCVLDLSEVCSSISNNLFNK